jgi:KDO2-lipid IV(A) lauroyltransferase
LTYALYAAAWTLVRRLPERVAYAVFEGIADVAVRRDALPVRRLRANLAQACPDLASSELHRLTREGMRSYLRYWCDAFRMPDWSRGRIVGTVRVEGEQHLRDNVGAGRPGVVAALMHMGNWDHAGAWAALTGAPVVTVAEVLEPQRLFERFVAYRTALGIEVLPLHGKGSDLLGTLAARLREGRLVPLLADRDLRSSGITVSFLGSPASLPPGPAILALQTGAPLHPVSIWHEDGPPGGPRTLVIRFHDAVRVASSGTTREKVAAMTQAVADVFGESIRAHPSDWHMLQRVWTTPHQPPPGGGG